MDYTVVAVYKDNMQVFVTHVDSPAPLAAAAKVRSEQRRAGYDMYVLCIFVRRHGDLYLKDEMMEAL